MGVMSRFAAFDTSLMDTAQFHSLIHLVIVAVGTGAFIAFVLTFAALLIGGRR